MREGGEERERERQRESERDRERQRETERERPCRGLDSDRCRQSTEELLEERKDVYKAGCSNMTPQR